MNKVEAWAATVGLLLIMLAIPANIYGLAPLVLVALPILLLVLLAA
jgi:hypothetical protein